MIKSGDFIAGGYNDGDWISSRESKKSFLFHRHLKFATPIVMELT